MTFASHPTAAILLPLLLILTCRGYLLVSSEGWPQWAAITLAALAVVPIVIGFLRMRLMYTGTSPECIAVRGLFRTRKTPWSDIQSMEIVRSHATDDARVVITERTGRRFKLPHLHASKVPDIEAELDKLHRLWIEFRGEDWTAERRSQ